MSGREGPYGGATDLDMKGMRTSVPPTVLMALLLHFSVMLAEVNIEEFARQPVLGCVGPECGWSPYHLSIVVMGEASIQDVAEMERILSGGGASKDEQAVVGTAERREFARRRYYLVQANAEQEEGEEDTCDRRDTECIRAECDALVTTVAAPAGGVWKVLAGLEADLVPLQGLLFVTSDVQSPHAHLCTPCTTRGNTFPTREKPSAGACRTRTSILFPYFGFRFSAPWSSLTPSLSLFLPPPPLLPSACLSCAHTRSHTHCRPAELRTSPGLQPPSPTATPSSSATAATAARAQT